MYDHTEYADYMGEDMDEEEARMEAMSDRRSGIEVTFSEVATIYGEDNDTIKVMCDLEAEGTEFCIRQDNRTILMSYDEANTLVEVLVRFLISME